jgi:hypothetical protein
LINGRAYVLIKAGQGGNGFIIIDNRADYPFEFFFVVAHVASLNRYGAFAQPAKSIFCFSTALDNKNQ